jgi:adenylate cyclase
MTRPEETDACHAALDMLKRMDALNQEREGEVSATSVLFVPIEMGIGRCTVGNMGSDLRFRYAVRETP